MTAPLCCIISAIMPINSALIAYFRPAQIHYDLPPSIFWLIWCGFLLLIVGVAYAAIRERRKRREALAQAAMEMGFIYYEKPDDALAAELAPIHLANASFEYKPRFANVLQGSAAGLEVVIGDRTVGAGKNQSTSTIFAFKFSTPFPAFVLCPENIFWRFAEKLGYSDLDIDGAPEFSRRFFLHAQDADAVRALFRPEVTQAFEQMDPNNKLYVSASGPWLVFYRANRIVLPPQFREVLQQAEVIVSAFRRAQSTSAFR